MVINIENEYYVMVTYFLGRDIGIRMTSRKDGVKKKSIHFSIPRLRSLFKVVESFLKVTEMARLLKMAQMLN